jgi:hypothetical protein
MLIGFTRKTSKILPRIFCRRFRHCAVLLWSRRRKKYIMLQPECGRIKTIPLSARDLLILKANGWIFVKHKAKGSKHRRNHIPTSSSMPRALTCVSFAKLMLGIRAPLVWTPDQLLEEL